MGTSFLRPWGLVLWWCMAWASGARAAEMELSRLAVPSDGDGVVILSLSVSSVDTMALVSFALMEGEGQVKLDQHSVGRPLFNFNEQLSGLDGRWGRVVALKLRPGTYRWGVVSSFLGGGGPAHIRNSEDIRRTFVVEPNKVLYLGNLDVLTVVEPGLKAGNLFAALLFGVMNFDVQAHSHVRNMWEADLKIIKSQRPSFDPAVVDTRLMRDERDDAIDQTVADVKAAAATGDAGARAAWAEASVFGYAMLPNLRHLRLPATLAFDPATFDGFVASAGNPAGLGALVQWALDNPVARTRAPMPLAPAPLQALVQAAADRYAVPGATYLLRDARFGVASDTALRGVWKNRARAVQMREGMSQSDVLETLLGKRPAEQLADIKAQRRLVAMTPSGRHVTWTSDGTEPLETAADQLIKRCNEDTGEACWIVAQDRQSRLPICNAAMWATGLAQAHPPAHWPDATAQAVAGAPWAAAYQQWLAQEKAAQTHPRSVVWDPGLQRAFTAAGDCLASHRAVQACKAQGGQVCQVVLQDDKLLLPAPGLTPPDRS